MARRRRKGNLPSAARRYAKVQVGPEKTAARSDIRAAGRERKAELRSNSSLAAALQEAIGNASAATQGVPGLSQQDLATALGELARRHLDVASGAALARTDIERRASESRQEGRDKLRDIAARQGTIAASRLDDLKQQKADRKIEQQKLGIEKASLALDQQKFQFDKYVKNQQLTIDMIKASGDAGKVTKAIKDGFNTALAKLRSSTYTPPGGSSTDKVPVTPKYVSEHRGQVTDGIAASSDIKGNRVLATAVVQRYLGEQPSSAVARYMRRTGIRLFPGLRRPGPGPGGHRP
jgi:hypothetical protein